MRSKWNWTIDWMWLVVLPLAAPALAHHSYTMFDMDKVITLEGRIKEVQWTNPHIWIQLLVKDAATGKEVEWSIEGASPNMLTRAGWTRKAVVAGDMAVVVIHPVRNSGNSSGSLATLSVNGRRIYGRATRQAGDTK
jgi:hypothetical protein